MKKKKRISKPKRINLDALYPVASADPSKQDLMDKYEYYNDLYSLKDEYEEFIDKLLKKYSYEKLEEMGFLEIPKISHTIPDGETGFIKTFKQGEDW